MEIVIQILVILFTLLMTALSVGVWWNTKKGGIELLAWFSLATVETLFFFIV